MEKSIPLIGRDDAMRCFVQLLGRAAPGRPVVLVVDGPPDSGRARLLREFVSAGRGRGAAVAATREFVILVRDHPEPVDAGDPDRLAARAPVLVVTTGRSLFTGISAEVHRIWLTPLTAADVQRLITALLGTRPGEWLLDLARAGAGRPGAIVRLITALREDGRTPVARLPERTRARLAERVATLSPPARHLVQAATALRSPFPPTRLSALLGRSLVTLLPDIEEALDSGLLVTQGDTLAFSHEQVRLIVEASMPVPVVAALRREQRQRTAPTRHRPPREAPREVDWALLSDRELQVAELVGMALTNQQIAVRLSRSPHTVNYHLRQIFRKLGLASRVELVSHLRKREATRYP
ncbi:helix-turn-helix transcriptional regulator [Paractinoplanes rishiriensis]|uniref:HTH luxR-type domain-containing protein n=1 Tax=Paractinoplanes rishiriensis TaxID=1050105 RepID=A0A919MTT2_9ACTN|nr:LuxR C-terminal-related transcriptional regulator [Actinoplanes rishiriensis]GIE94614.1 hypothetical protein Ari01nite_20790 [Actinoplanes rishiriensis]